MDERLTQTSGGKSRRDTRMTAERRRIDVAALKHAINLVEFARQYTLLRTISQTGEGAGPCPCCGGNDRFHVKGDRFYCRQCYPRGGDVIDLIMWVEDISFQEACQRLTGHAPSFSERPIPTSLQPAAQVPEAPRWQTDAFQDSARRTMAATQQRLIRAEGRAGQAYLAGRGILPATWERYKLGYGTTFHPVRHEQQAAIFLPWMSAAENEMTAIQHRFIDPALAQHERYSLKPSSAPLVFGLHALAPAETVVIVEGEFNGMALHQAGAQAVSVGSESNRANAQTLALLQTQLASYGRLVVWFDQPALGQQLAERVREKLPFKKEKDILVVDAPGADANDLLMRGDLAAFLRSYGILDR